MKIYFLSAQPCALSLNGVHYGVTDTFERTAELSLSDRLYVQFAPEGKLPLGFFLTEEIRTRPPEGCDVYLLRDGVAVYAHDFSPLDYTLRPVAQQREGTLLATVFVQGKPQLNIQSPAGFFNATLPPSFEQCTLQFHCGLLLVITENALALFTAEGKRLLLEQIRSYELIEKGLNATLPLSDSLGRTAKCTWELTPDSCTLTHFTLQQPSDGRTLPEGLLAYAFLESVLLKADYAQFLSEELLPDADDVLAFLGDFRSVVLTKEPNVCALVRAKGERLFALDYVSVQIKEGKITDVRG